MFDKRFESVRSAMSRADIDMLLLSVGADLPWLTGYEAMPLERLTMLAISKESKAKLFIPRLEAARVVERPDLFDLVAWDENQNPVSIVADLIKPKSKVAIGGHTWSKFLLQFQTQTTGVSWTDATDITGPLRAVKDPHEIERLRAAAEGVDRIAAALQQGEIKLIGRKESEIAEEFAQRILAEGHAKVNFTIVASGENAASPHHEAGSRVVQPNEVVLFDFGGTTIEKEGEPGYCSDITRCVYTGTPPQEFVDSYDALQEAQEAGVQAATVGASAASVDAAAREVLRNAGLGEWFIHRLGHGIGVEAHEDPYLVETNQAQLAAGNAFSIEPGFYIPGKWGARIEDIVIATNDGPISLNKADHNLAIVE